MALTFWERAHLKWVRSGAKWSKWGPDVYLESLLNHGITESCMLRVAERETLPQARAKVADEMALLRAKANEKRGQGLMSRMDVQLGTALLCLLFLEVITALPKLLKSHNAEVGWLREIANRYGLAMLLIVVAAVVGLGLAHGQVTLWKRLCTDWSERFAGKGGMDSLDDVVAWLDAKWRWFLPPDFATIDVMWATGNRRGAPVLAVLEQGQAHFAVASIRKRAATGHGGVAPVMWTRVNLFIHGVRLHDVAHRERVVKALNSICGGVVQCPSGVYVYGAFAFLGTFDAEGPSSEIWVDLADQIIDPQFRGSPSATRKRLDELRRMGLLAGVEMSHG